VPFTPGFNFNEATNLLALSAYIEGVRTLPLPLNWKLIFDSPVLPPFDNKWQLWQNTSSDSGAGMRLSFVGRSIKMAAFWRIDLLTYSSDRQYHRRRGVR
jgi:hypothetical protein